MSDNNTSDYDSFNHSKRFTCEECDSTFSKLYNLERHIDKFHPDSDSASDSDQSCSDQNESENESMSTDDKDEDMSNDKSDEDMSDDERSSDDEETESNLTTMFKDIIFETFARHEDELDPLIKENLENGLTKKEAEKRALLSSHEAKKTIQHLYVENIINIMEQMADPVFKAILKKAKELIDDGFKSREAVISAVSYRKHAIRNLVNFL